MEHVQKNIFKNTATLRAELQKDNTPHFLAIKAISIQLPVLSCNRGLWHNIQTTMKEKVRNKKVSLVYAPI